MGKRREPAGSSVAVSAAAESKRCRTAKQDEIVIPDAALKCVICKDFLQEPMMTQCQHTFCKECILSALRADARCPSCRASVRRSKLSRCDPLKRIINELEVPCPNEGCTEVVARGNLVDHEPKCGFALIECANSSKCDKILRKDIKTHDKVCPNKSVSCSLRCGWSGLRKDVARHRAMQCIKARVKCPKCSVILRRGGLKEHKLAQCPKEKIKCVCGKKNRIVREEWIDHIKTDLPSHVGLMCDTIRRSEAIIATQEHQISCLFRQLAACQESLKKIEAATSKKKVRLTGGEVQHIIPAGDVQHVDSNDSVSNTDDEHQSESDSSDDESAHGQTRAMSDESDLESSSDASSASSVVDTAIVLVTDESDESSDDSGISRSGLEDEDGTEEEEEESPSSSRAGSASSSRRRR